LLGLLPPDDFQKTLQKEVGLKNGTAKQVAQEIYRHIFFPVRSLLEELYKVDIAARLAKPSIEPTAKARGARAAVPTSEGPAKAPAGAEAPTKTRPQKADVYREPVE
jgi:hypothetical protein